MFSIIMLASCSGPADQDDHRVASNDTSFQILPEAPLADNELRLIHGSGPAATVSASRETEGDQNSGFIWSVNEQDVGRGLSLAPGLFRRGDRVSVRLELDDVSIERAFVIIGNAPPEIRGVSVHRDTENPDLAVAIFSAIDPDGDRIGYRFEWFVDGAVVQDADGFELHLDNHNRGAEILVTLWASDDELTVSRSSSTARLGNHAPEFTVSTRPQIVDSDNGRWAELGISYSDSDGDALKVDVFGNHVSFDKASGVLRWGLIDGNEEFTVTVRISDPAGASAERELRLKR